jgi:hypothetical protein
MHGPLDALDPKTRLEAGYVRFAPVTFALEEIYDRQT